MLRLRLVQVIVLLSTLGIGAALTTDSAAAQSDPELEAFNQRRIELYSSGEYEEAIPLAQRYAEAMRGRHGAEHPQYATALHDLAVLLQATDRLAEAESLYRRALEIDEKSYGPEHTNVANRLHYLAGLTCSRVFGPIIT